MPPTILLTHPPTEAVTALIEKYPETSDALLQVYNDVLNAPWLDVEVIDLGARSALKGRMGSTVIYAVPCNHTETISNAWIQDKLKAFSTDTFYMAISTYNASIVWYSLVVTNKTNEKTIRWEPKKPKRTREVKTFALLGAPTRHGS